MKHRNLSSLEERKTFPSHTRLRAREIVYRFLRAGKLRLPSVSKTGGLSRQFLIPEDVVFELLKRAETQLPADVLDALRTARKREKNRLARIQLDAILENISLAGERCAPICQDTGVPVFYVDLGSRSTLPPSSLIAAISSGVRKATRELPMRANIVHPLSRRNSGDNTGWGTPIVHITSVEGASYTDVTVLPKGAGSENMSALAMLQPSQGISGVKAFVVDVVRRAGGKPCPPVIVGVGVGGTADHAMHLAKKALLRPLSCRNSDRHASRLEKEILQEINMLDIGPMGLGGTTTALGVNVELSGCHTASLPVAVNLQCWAARVAKARIEGKRVTWLR